MKDFINRALPILQEYARKNPRWYDPSRKIWQDPMGVHQLLEELSAQQGVEAELLTCDICGELADGDTQVLCRNCVH